MSYAEMRENGLCPKCGKENPTPDKSRCPICAERDSKNRKENRQYLKKIGMCVRCGKNKAEPNKTLCYECIGKESDSYYASERTEEQKERDRNRKRELAEERIANGICPKCGKYKSDNGGICKKCKAYLRQYRNKNRHDITRSERPNYGICYICGENPVMEDKKVCEKCYQDRIRTLPAMWENRNNEYFKQLNYARICMVKSRKRSVGGAE